MNKYSGNYDQTVNFSTRHMRVLILAGRVKWDGISGGYSAKKSGFEEKFSPAPKRRALSFDSAHLFFGPTKKSGV